MAFFRLHYNVPRSGKYVANDAVLVGNTHNHVLEPIVKSPKMDVRKKVRHTNDLSDISHFQLLFRFIPGL